ncbi:MAG: hypothetical protein OXC08_15595 [Thiotrichales bacterium]|nr:hypothetical protein [Thiotrichales bacterium]
MNAEAVVRERGREEGRSARLKNCVHMREFVSSVLDSWHDGPA